MNIIGELNNVAGNLHNARELIEGYVYTLVEQVREKDAELLTLRDELDTYGTQLSEERTKVRHMTCELQTLDQTIGVCEKRIVELEDENHSFKKVSRVIAVEKENEKLKKQLNKEAEKVADLIKKNAELIKKCAEVKKTDSVVVPVVDSLVPIVPVADSLVPIVPIADSLVPIVPVADSRVLELMHTNKELLEEIEVLTALLKTSKGRK
jgi:hypothetical protein